MINQHQFQQSARHFRSGRISLSEFQSRVFAGTETKPHQTKPHQSKSTAKPAPTQTPSIDVTLDLDQTIRCGWSEVIVGEGKTIESLVEILNQLSTAGHPALITRVSNEVGAELASQITDGDFDATSKTFTRGNYVKQKTFNGEIVVIAAGTSDLLALEEACSTIRWMGGNVNRIDDLGDAGADHAGADHAGADRLEPHLDTLKSASAIVVVAGIEETLPNVVAGHVGCPVFAVPTSDTHNANGAKPERVAALLTTLNSCPANVAVVTINAGFKAGYLAAMVSAKR